MFFSNRWPAKYGANPVIVYGFPSTDEKIEELSLDPDVPVEFMGEISKLVGNKRGQLLDMTQEGSQVMVKAKMPVAEMFGMTSDLRSATEGRGMFFMVDQGFEKLSEELQQRIIAPNALVFPSRAIAF